jgi:hypothetical protein
MCAGASRIELCVEMPRPSIGHTSRWLTVAPVKTRLMPLPRWCVCGMLTSPARPRYLIIVRLNWVCLKEQASIIGIARSAGPAPLLSPSASRTSSVSVERAEEAGKVRPQRPSLNARDFPETGLKSLRLAGGAIWAPMPPAVSPSRRQPRIAFSFRH